MDKLQKLQMLACETEEGAGYDGLPSSRMFTDEELIKWLAFCKGDPKKAAYEMLLRKAENTEITLPGGIQTPDNSQYFLRLAKRLHTPKSGCSPRADGT